MADTIHVGDVGTILRVECVKDGTPVPVGSATSMQILLQDPTGKKKQLPAVFTTDGLDGKIEAETIEGTIDTVGMWKMQGYIQFGTKSFHTDTSQFDALASLLPTT